MKISIFYVNNEKGIELRDSIHELLSIIFNQGEIFLFSSIEATQQLLAKKAMFHDLIVFDASIEQNHNYNIAAAQPMASAYILIVSRTYLPLNFSGIRLGGYPQYPFSMTNSDILLWLKSEIQKVKPYLPRKNKGLFGYFNTMSEALKLKHELRANTCDIFISYRSKYFNEVNILKEKIESGAFHGAKKAVFFLPPEQITYQDEVMPEFMWWQLQTIIDDLYMRYAEEIWIYNDCRREYFKSWWTQGELVSLVYRKSKQKLRIYDELSGKVTEAPKSYLLNIDRDDKKRLTRWFSNTIPETMGPESRYFMKKWRSNPFIGDWLYFDDDAWKDEFWDYLVLPCMSCAKKALGEELTPDNFNVRNFLWLRENLNIKKIARHGLYNPPKKNHYTCKGCKTEYELVIIEDSPRFLWYANRMGKQTAPNGGALDHYPVVRMKKLR